MSISYTFSDADSLGIVDDDDSDFAIASCLEASLSSTEIFFDANDECDVFGVGVLFLVSCGSSLLPSSFELDLGTSFGTDALEIGGVDEYDDESLSSISVFFFFERNAGFGSLDEEDEHELCTSADEDDDESTSFDLNNTLFCLRFPFLALFLLDDSVDDDESVSLDSNSVRFFFISHIQSL